MDKVIDRLSAHETIIAGVAAHIAGEFNWSLLWTRVIGTMVVVFNPFIGGLVYLVLALLIKNKPKV
ncbi:PspC domain-containing protein [Shewanella sp. SR44-3]|uniref:PspC domain-containing protein n=1 Tax=unclassified Shewanella TaxID=196818 RepID=UPI0015FDD8EB|nr:PspC domain-containing protein [Shewanella sp. SR44-3]MBB1268318.1 PspC domain-containing protein [Shewanella sp. SR44-3]